MYEPRAEGRSKKKGHSFLNSNARKGRGFGVLIKKSGTGGKKEKRILVSPEKREEGTLTKVALKRKKKKRKKEA